jgi:hypothetical protein
MSFLLREIWDEFRLGLRNGIVPLIFIVLSGYILLVVSNAESLQEMGAVDVPRNAPALVFLMTSGDTFFLFFAWAWVFAQPILRDHKAQLHEVVLAAPISLRGLLTARYLGALGVALVIGCSQIAGFLIAPVLEWSGGVPSGSFAPAPWSAFAWGTLIFTLPLSAGAGALYFIATIKSRGLGGPLAVAAALMTFWMVSMIILKGSHADPFLSTLLDPSGFAETEHQVVDHWTPYEKSNSLLALSDALLWNRLIWCGMPLLLLGFVLWRIRREALVLETAPRVKARKVRSPARTSSAAPNRPVGHADWWRAAVAESLWQVRQILGRRWMGGAVAMLLILGVAGAFVHGIQHAYGPMVPRPELVTPLLSKMFFLIIVFMVAGVVGVAARRDHQPGLGEMFDATPAPGSVRLAGLATATLATTVTLALLPGVSGILTTLIIAPQNLKLLQPLLHQLVVLTPALLEIATLTLLLHALIPRPGPAHGASMLAAFIMIVNHETDLVSYPPLQIGLPVQIALSGTSGLIPWSEKLLISDGFKLTLVVLLLALAAMVTIRGTEHCWRLRALALRQRFFGGAGVVAVSASLAMLGFALQMHQRYVVEGGYQNRNQELTSDAHWEQHWLGMQTPFSVQGGEVELVIHPDTRRMSGYWRMQGMQTNGGTLHAELPLGFSLESARVQGKEAATLIDEDHLALELGNCPPQGCEVELRWSLSATGWDAQEHPPWLTRDGYWLHAPEVMPRLGFDGDRVLRTPQVRERLGLPLPQTLPNYRATLPSGAAAPAGQWSWRVIHGNGSNRRVHQDQTDGLLDFADLWAPSLARTKQGDVMLLHDKSRHAPALSIAGDVVDMQRCVADHLGRSPIIRNVAQWPRALGVTKVANTWLLLAEAPHWDVADQGVGRLVRRAEIAAALARRTVRDAADLREGDGAIWLNDGLPGAIGLLCVAQTDGPEALLSLLSHGADQVVRSLAASPVLVGSLRQAPSEGWAVDYAPLAALHWTMQQSPDSLAQLLKQVRDSGDLPAVLASVTGTIEAATMLGPPSASDIHLTNASETRVIGKRWQWRDGGWVATGSKAVPWQFQIAPSRAIYLDAWPAYERTPDDNVDQYAY